MLGTFAQPGLGQTMVASQEASPVEILEVIQAAPTQEYFRSLKTRPTPEACHALELQEDGIEPRGGAGTTMASLFTLGVTACS